MLQRLIKNPMTRRRLARFKRIRRAYVSFWVLVVLYGLSLGSELICNSSPLYVRFEGRSYFPVLIFYPEDVFTGSGKKTRPDYYRILHSAAFSADPDNFMIFPPFPHGPFQSLNPERIAVSKDVTVRFDPLPIVGTATINRDFQIVASFRLQPVLQLSAGAAVGGGLADYVPLTDSLKRAIQGRFADQAMPRFTLPVTLPDGVRYTLSLATYRPRGRPPQTLKVVFREAAAGAGGAALTPVMAVFDSRPEPRTRLSDAATALLGRMRPSDRRTVLERVALRRQGEVDDLRLEIDGRLYLVSFEKQEVRFPFGPVAGHPLGLDGAGRDVLARIVYGLRTSMSFGFLLVAGSMVLGILAGALQGYYGGLTDITGQRLVEIWSALPFLYVMILMGSIYGRSFSLLLFCYGLFNWIGISYYIRAEFLRLRRQPFVEAARCMGVSNGKIMFKHILPNAMIPVITFFPFSLVGAIGALAALDYLGFGLPPPTPSWGELLFQAQQYRWAWWLILYPSLALFLVMLLGVFVGEGIRGAHDPKPHARVV